METIRGDYPWLVLLPSPDDEEQFGEFLLGIGNDSVHKLIVYPVCARSECRKYIFTRVDGSLPGNSSSSEQIRLDNLVNSPRLLLKCPVHNHPFLPGM